MNIISSFNIRHAAESDGVVIWKLKRLLHEEGEYLRLSPQDKEKTISDEIIEIQSTKFDKSLILVAMLVEDIVGYLSAVTNDNGCTITKVTLGILRAHQGKGIGSALIKEMESWAQNAKIKRIEMRVMTHNLPALGLYKKIGYEIVGTNSPYLLYDSNRTVNDYTVMKEII